MTMMNKKELQFEEMNSIVGGNAVGPVKETGPLGYVDQTGPLGYPYREADIPPKKVAYPY